MPLLVFQSFQVVARIKARDLSRRIAVTIPKLDFFAVGQKDEWINTKLGIDSVCIIGRLAFAGEFVSRRALGFDDRKRYLVRAQQNIIGKLLIAVCPTRISCLQQDLFDERSPVLRPARACKLDVNQFGSG